MLLVSFEASPLEISRGISWNAKTFSNPNFNFQGFCYICMYITCFYHIQSLVPDSTHSIDYNQQDDVLVELHPIPRSGSGSILMY